VEITVVGSGTVVPRPDRGQSCVVVRAGEEVLAFDLGAGAVRGMVAAGLDPFATERIFFTHFHPDHTLEAVNLLFAMNYGTDEPRTRPLHVTGPEPFEDFWSSVLGVWGEWMQGDFAIRTRELPHSCDTPIELGGCSLTWAPVAHRPESIAYRMDADGGSFVYTGDTEYSESLVGLANGADTLLVECSFPDDAPVPGHLTPGGVARIAREASVGRVVLTHLYPPVDDGRLPGAVREGFDGEVLVAHDGLQLRV
jgi:ribonuclease BN (tRNA processing enzyme)